MISMLGWFGRLHDDNRTQVGTVTRVAGDTVRLTVFVQSGAMRGYPVEHKWRNVDDVTLHADRFS